VQVHALLAKTLASDGFARCLRIGGNRASAKPLREVWLCSPDGREVCLAKTAIRWVLREPPRDDRDPVHEVLNEDAGSLSRAAWRNATQGYSKRTQAEQSSVLRDSEHLPGAEPARTRKGNGARGGELREDRWGIARAEVKHPGQASMGGLARDGDHRRRVPGGLRQLNSWTDSAVTGCPCRALVSEA
jgi:hypothetical protein